MSRRAIVGALLVLGTAAFICGTQPWFTASGSTALDPSVPVEVRGADAAPVVGAASLVVMAGALALGLVGRIAGRVVLGVVVAAGAVVAASAIAVMRDPLPSTLAAAAESTGVTQISAGVSVGLAGWVAAAMGAAVVVTAGWALWSAGSWRNASARHEPPHVRPGRLDDDRDVWDALSSGEDPT